MRRIVRVLGWLVLLLALVGGTARSSTAQTTDRVSIPAQESADPIVQPEQWPRVEILPTLRHSDRSLQTELQSTLELPRRLRGMDAGGVGRVRFVVDAAGTVTEVMVVQGWKFIGIDRAVAKAIKNMEFTPGRHGSQPVAVVMYLPLHIQGF